MEQKELSLKIQAKTEMLLGIPSDYRDQGVMKGYIFIYCH